MNITITLTQEDLQDKDVWIAAKVIFERFSLRPEVAEKATKTPEKTQKEAEIAPKEPETVQKQTEMDLPKSYKLTELRAAATDLAQAKGAAAVKAILAKYDAASVTSLKPEHYVAFMADMEAAQ